MRSLSGRRWCRVHGPALRCVREAREWSGVALAEEIGVDADYLYKIERGHQKRIQPELYDRILRTLRITDRRVLLADPWVD